MSKTKKFQVETDKDRSRVWAFEVYPDSADQDWLKYLGESLIHAYVSPLHDKDIDPDGNPKKAHFHIMLMYDTVQYPHQVIEDVSVIAAQGVGGCNILENYEESDLESVVFKGKKREHWIGYDQDGKCFGQIQKIRSKSGMARYLCHMDNADKYRYSEEDVIVFGKPDYLDVCGSNINRYEILNEMREFCILNNVLYYGDLYDYAANERPMDWFRVLSDSGTYVMDRYIKSLNYKVKQQNKDALKYKSLEANEKYSEYLDSKRKDPE